MSSPKILDGIKLFIFDVDGVLFDIYNALYETVQHGIEKYKLTLPIDQAMEEVGQVLEIAQSSAIPELILNANELFGDLKLFEGMTLLKRLRVAVSLYSEFRTRKDQADLFPGVENLIKGLTSKKIQLAILSNNKRTYVVEALQKRNLAKYFDAILGFNEVTKTKPDPEGLLRIMDELGISPEETIFIGDMVSDIEAGKNANIKTIANLAGLASEEKLIAANPDFIVKDILDLNRKLEI